MAEITPRMKRIAYEWEAAAIEAGHDYAKLSYMSREWCGGDSSTLQAFAVDKDNKSKIWKEGE